MAETHAYPFGVARARFLVGITADWQGDVDRAIAMFEEALVRGRDLGAPYWIARLLTCLADTTHLLGNNDRAQALAEQGLTMAREVDHAWTTALALGVLANLATDRGDLMDAVRLYEESLVISQQLGDKRGIGGTVAGLAGVVLARGGTERAVRLLGAARALGDTIGVAHLGHHLYAGRVLAAARAQLDSADFDAAWKTGYRSLPADAITAAITAARDAVTSPTTTRSSARDATRLTARELEVLRLVVAGRSDREIGADLYISHRTVNAHVAHIFAKLEVNTRAAVAAAAMRGGLVSGE